MKAHEFGEEDSRALGLMLAPESIAGLGEELRLAKAALLDGKARWRDKCALVMWVKLLGKNGMVVTLPHRMAAVFARGVEQCVGRA